MLIFLVSSLRLYSFFPRSWWLNLGPFPGKQGFFWRWQALCLGLKKSASRTRLLAFVDMLLHLICYICIVVPRKPTALIQTQGSFGPIINTYLLVVLCNWHSLGIFPTTLNAVPYYYNNEIIGYWRFTQKNSPALAFQSPHLWYYVFIIHRKY